MVKVHECVPNDPDPALADGCDTTGQVYWEATEVDINGAITRAQLGNGLVTEREVNKVTGAIRSIRTSGLDANNQHVEIQDQEFRWDLAGNLEMRHDRRIHDQGGIKQEFDYDALDRLTGTTTHYNIAGVDAQSRYNVYADNGNLRCKEHTSSTCATEYRYHPGTHAVASATGASTDDYGYDANGSMTHGPNGRHIKWTAFNKPLRIDGAGNAYARFAYDHNRARYRMESSDGSATTVTTYIGSLYERVQTGDTTTHRFQIFAGGEAVAPRIVARIRTAMPLMAPEPRPATCTRTTWARLLRSRTGLVRRRNGFTTPPGVNSKAGRAPNRHSSRPARQNRTAGSPAT